MPRDIAFQLAAKGIDGIIDEGVWSKEHRDLLRKRAEDVGAQFDHLILQLSTSRSRPALPGGSLGAAVHLTVFPASAEGSIVDVL